MQRGAGAGDLAFAAMQMRACHEPLRSPSGPGRTFAEKKSLWSPWLGTQEVGKFVEDLVYLEHNGLAAYDS